MDDVFFFFFFKAFDRSLVFWCFSTQSLLGSILRRQIRHWEDFQRIFSEVCIAAS